MVFFTLSADVVFHNFIFKTPLQATLYRVCTSRSVSDSNVSVCGEEETSTTVTDSEMIENEDVHSDCKSDSEDSDACN